MRRRGTLARLRWRVPALFLSLLVVVAQVGPAAPVAAAQPDSGPLPLDIGPELRGKVLPVDVTTVPVVAGPAAAGFGMASVGYDPVPGTEKIFPALDYVAGRYYLKVFVLRGVSENAEVWVAKNLSFPSGDPRNDRIEVTDEQVAYLLQEFEGNIRPKEVEFFGAWDAHDGSNALLPELVPPNLGLTPDYYQPSDGKGREIILVDNIRDESYFDPTYPAYVAGFYSSAVELYTDRNVVTIDNLDWAQRLGANDAPWRRDPAKGVPHLYEGVLAHEFQHLIHDDHDPDEDSWINEGMSDFAEFLVGYGHPDSHVASFLQNPENSLTGWGDQGDRQILADYGLAYLFTLYLHDHYGGGPLLQALVADEANGSAGVDNVLAAFGHKERFADVFRDFNVALVMDGRAPAGSRYDFPSIDLAAYGGLVTRPAASGSAGVPGWGTHFLSVAPPESGPPVVSVQFKGQDFLPTPWTIVDAPQGGDGKGEDGQGEDGQSEHGKALWSGAGNLLDNWLVLPVDLTGASSAELTFDHYYVIEEAWDYAFVQVSTDGGRTWQSLANENTTDVTDPNAHPRVKANVPGFTGIVDGWRTERFDLSEYAGRSILLAFRYVTDWAFVEQDGAGNAGWYVDNIAVQADGATVAAFDGGSLEGFASLYEATNQPVQYLVSLVELKKGGQVKVTEIRFRNRPSAEDLNTFQQFLAGKGAEAKYILISHAAPEDSAQAATYDLTIQDHKSSKGE